jgi:hypothetical protein
MNGGIEMITTNDLLALKSRYEDELRMAKAKIAVVDELLSIEESKVEEAVEADEQGETEVVNEENLVDESY